MSDRERVLGAIRAALADVGAGEPDTWTPEADPVPAAAYTRTSSLSTDELSTLFAQRCGEYRATVTRCGVGAEATRAAVDDACARHGARSLAVAPGVDPAWVPRAVSQRRDQPPLSVAELDACDGALTAAACAIATTGTVVLDGSPDQGRRALTLIPDLHVCVVDAVSIVGGVPEAIALLTAAVGRRRAPLTFISGPSATSDIELERVEGVHGPRQLEVILVSQDLR